MKRFMVPILVALMVAILILSGCVAPAEEPTAPTAPTAPTTPTTPTEPTEPADPWAHVVVDEWFLPVILPKTGGFASFGIECEWAMNEAVKDINAAGGIAGKPVRLEFYDSATDPSQAHAVTARVLDTKPLFILMNDVGAAAEASMDLIVTEKVFAIMPACGSPTNLEFEPWNTSFLNYHENICAAGIPEWMAANPDIKSVVQFYDATLPILENCANEKVLAVEASGGTDAGEVSFEQFTTVEFGPIAVAALAKNPDGFAFTLSGATAAKLIIELQRRGVAENRRFFVDACADYPEFFTVGEGLVDGIYMQSLYDPNHPGEEWQSIKQRYEASTDVPMGMGVYFGYDEVRFFKAAVEATGVTGDPAKLAEERQLLADWAWNVDDYEFLMGKVDVVNGFAMQPMYLHMIVNNEKELFVICPAETVPEKYR